MAGDFGPTFHRGEAHPQAHVHYLQEAHRIDHGPNMADVDPKGGGVAGGVRAPVAPVAVGVSGVGDPGGIAVEGKEGQHQTGIQVDLAIRAQPQVAGNVVGRPAPLVDEISRRGSMPVAGAYLPGQEVGGVDAGRRESQYGEQSP